MIILKWILKKLVLFLDLIHQYSTDQCGILGKFNEVINIKINTFKYIAIELF